MGIGWLYLKLVVWSLGGFQGGYWGWWKSRGKGGGKMVSGVGKNAGGWGGVGGSGGESFEPGGGEVGRAYSDIGGRWCLCRNEGTGLVGKCTTVGAGGYLAHGGLDAGWAFLRKGSEESSEWIFRLFGLFGVVGLE